MAKKKPDIYIKPENRGSFTSYCNSKGYNGVTQKCIDKAKSSGSTALKKKAVFAENSRNKWNKGK